MAGHTIELIKTDRSGFGMIFDGFSNTFSRFLLGRQGAELDGGIYIDAHPPAGRGSLGVLHRLGYFQTLPADEW